jgi:hypothetical protein
MSRLQKYIHEILGIDIKIQSFPGKKLAALPVYIRDIYTIKAMRLYERKIILLIQNEDEFRTADQYRKHIRQIGQTFDLPVVLVLDPIEAYNRKRLIEKQIAFIIPGKQIFLPQLMIDLKEFGYTAKSRKEKIQPAAQCLLLYHLLKENVEEMNLKLISKKLNYTQMTITRAVNDLAERAICRIEGRKDKKIIFDTDKRMIWEKALPFLQNPVKRKFYIEDNLENSLLYKAGISALAFYTNIAGDAVDCYAIAKNDFMYLNKHRQIHITNNIEGRYCIEIWKYAPAILAENRIVDSLSLYLTLKDENDERVETEIEKMVSILW